jgi:tetratricopeptide (TPR) repeat protein
VIRLMKGMSLDQGFEYKSDALAKVQNQYVDINLLPIFSMRLFPDTNISFSVYEAFGKVYYSMPTVILAQENGLDFKKAQKQIAHYDSMIKAQPNNSDNYLFRAMLRSSCSDHQRAIKDFDKAILLDSNNLMAYLGRANTQFQLEEIIASVEDSKVQISTFDNFGSSPKMTVKGDVVYYKMLRDYSMVKKLDSTFSYVWFNMANLKIWREDYSGGLHDFNFALNCDPEFSHAYYNRGLVYLLLQENEKACADLSKAGELGIKEAYFIMKRYCYK